MFINDYVKQLLIGRTVFVLGSIDKFVFCGKITSMDEEYVYFQDRKYDIYDFNFHFSIDEFKKNLFTDIDYEEGILSRDELEELIYGDDENDRVPCPECAGNPITFGLPMKGCWLCHGWGTVKKEDLE